MFLLEHVFVHNLFNTSPIYLPAGFLSEMYYGEDFFFFIVLTFLCCCHTLRKILSFHSMYPVEIFLKCKIYLFFLNILSKLFLASVWACK